MAIFGYMSSDLLRGDLFVICVAQTAQDNHDHTIFSAFFHLIRGQGPDLHDDVQAVAECSAG